VAGQERRPPARRTIRDRRAFAEYLRMASYVHHCAFCRWSRDADDLAVLDPACERCGCTLTADTLERYEEVRRAPGGEARERRTWDMTGPSRSSP
jgi:hypothetical protein